MTDWRMAGVRDEFALYCSELLSVAGPVRVRRMFGGHGLYVDGLFVAIIADERLYLKVDATSHARFEAAGCQPFVYMARGQPHSLNYFSAPDEAMESPALMAPWVRLAIEAALRARASQAARGRPRQRKPRAGA
jgi:DNA transformation protein and related proteins